MKTTINIDCECGVGHLEFEVTAELTEICDGQSPALARWRFEESCEHCNRSYAGVMQIVDTNVVELMQVETVADIL